MKTNDQKPAPMILRLPERYRNNVVTWNGQGPRRAGPFSGELFDVAFRGEVTSNADQRGAVWGCSVTIDGPHGLTMRKFGRTGGIRAALYCMGDLIRVAVWQVRHDRGLEDDLPGALKASSGAGVRKFSRPSSSTRRKNSPERSA